jgi:hypothetical protein
VSFLADLERLAGILPPSSVTSGPGQGGIIGAIVSFLEHGPAILEAAVVKEGEDIHAAAGRVSTIIGEAETAAGAEAAKLAGEVEGAAKPSYDDLVATIAQLRGEPAPAPAAVPPPVVLPPAPVDHPASASDQTILTQLQELQAGTIVQAQLGPNATADLAAAGGDVAKAIAARQAGHPAAPTSTAFPAVPTIPVATRTGGPEGPVTGTPSVGPLSGTPSS